MNNRNTSNINMVSYVENTFISDEDLFCRPQDLSKECEFEDFRKPNEASAINVQPHLRLMEKGWIISTGTERSFFDLLLSPAEQCEGLIIVDINPKVKAYCDFLVLLLCCAKDKDEFCELSDSEKKFLNLEGADKVQFIATLKEKLLAKMENTSLSQKMKAYFKDNFEFLATSYLEVEHDALGDRTGIEYRKDDALFEKLKKYALAGKIIAKVGDINDLSFANGRKISVIDTSNISQYVSIKPKDYGDSTPRIIFTNFVNGGTIYFSALYQKLTDEEYNAIEQYMSLFRNSNNVLFTNMVNIFTQKENDPFNRFEGNCYTKSNVISMRDSFKYLLEYNVTMFASDFLTKDAYEALTNLSSNNKLNTKAEKILDNLLNASDDFLVNQTQIKSIKSELQVTCNPSMQSVTFFADNAKKVDVLLFLKNNIDLYTSLTECILFGSPEETTGELNTLLNVLKDAFTSTEEIRSFLSSLKGVDKHDRDCLKANNARKMQEILQCNNKLNKAINQHMLILHDLTKDQKDDFKNQLDLINNKKIQTINYRESFLTNNIKSNI